MNTLTKIERNRESKPVEVTYVAPPVDITESKDEYLLQADMPGVTKETLEVVLDDNELTLIGRRTPAAVAGEVLHRESTTHDFRRTFVLDPVIDRERITAQIDQGLLTVHLPKAEKVKPRRIAVGD